MAVTTGETSLSTLVGTQMLAQLMGIANQPLQLKAYPEDAFRQKPTYGSITVHSMSVLQLDYPNPQFVSKGVIQVGHDESSLTKDRTLESLYINPILDVLRLQNPSSPFLTSPTNNGVFDTSTSQTLYFFIDVKTSGPETFKAVISALQPLRDHGYLTTLKDNKTLTTGPVTIIGTGNTPLDLVGPIADRDYFYDAPLEALTEALYADITGLISPIASTDFAATVGSVKGEKISDEQIKTLRKQIQTAKERGIGARYWDTPHFPVRTRNFVWRTLLEEGVALLNADDLDAVVEYF
ncbi:hypothetical protein AbraIFM66951_010191 [Aspergillus brasiliensis]|uniref:Altered inheritance of mitochondria protein 6 n=1 Tax=Aspergillus brasiliensis TaxID=319629 RepID=A0A9W5YNX0_9EURO|nr:hypothetical protein AbraCBS73388_006622 [Aspergillus brasiliensis]GKZ47016.1 hypothetical protein AbraIFM66951_010191 [Aspergillus brasiliensis]